MPSKINNEQNNKSKFRLAAVVSHPIQYQIPFFRYLSSCNELDFKVFFCSKCGLETYYDKGFSRSIKWDIPLLEGYEYEFLSNLSFKQEVSSFLGLINPSIIEKLRNGKFHAVWVHGWNTFTNLLTVFAASSMNISVLIRGESNFLHSTSFWKNKLKNYLLPGYFQQISGFLAIGKHNADYYKYFGVPEEKIFSVPYTVNNDFFLSHAEKLIPLKSTLKNRLGIASNIPVILYCGKLINSKNPMDLLKAYSQVINDTETALIYVGDGLLRNELERYVSENNIKNVYFAGFKNQGEISELYSIADIFVLPSSYEPWGLVVNEAMCFALPVVITDKVGAGGNLVKHGENGFIYKSGEVVSLVKILKILLKDEDLRKKMGKCSLDIINKWSYKEGTEGILKSLKSLVHINYKKIHQA